ncbi:MAG TPA: ABC transporter transmembrane domain-containing protein, partial [Ktedonobacteraceae bacterium]
MKKKKGMSLARHFFRYAPRLRLFLAVNVLIGGVLGILVLFQAYYLSQVITAAFLRSQALSEVWPLLLALLLTILSRALVSGGKTLLANQIASYLKQETRQKVLSHLFTLGPAMTREERSGELVNTLVEGVEALDPYFSQYVPQVFLAV